MGGARAKTIVHGQVEFVLAAGTRARMVGYSETITASRAVEYYTDQVDTFPIADEP